MSVRRTFTSLGGLALAAATVFAPVAAQATPRSAAPAGHTLLPTIGRQEVMARAETWHPHTPQRIPYSQTATHDGYRTDCSGYASMALGLGRPGLNTVALARPAVSTPIPMRDLQTGDLVIDATGDHNTRHVVIFQRWANPARSSYWEYEQRGGYGTDHRIVRYGLTSGSQFHAYRPRVLS